MTRAEKVTKLSHAVKDWRGSKGVSGNWIRVPKPGAVVRVRKWAGELGLDVEKTVQFISNLKTYDDFYNWLRSLY